MKRFLACVLLCAFSSGPWASDRGLGAPLVFVEDGDGLWARSAGMAARFDDTGFALELGGAARVAFSFEGAARVVPEGLGPVAGRVNVLSGRDPRGWARGLAAYRRLRWRGLYPGVDVAVRASGGLLEYDLLIAPGASVSDVVLRCEGAEGIDLEGDELVLRTAAGELRQRVPRTFHVRADGTREELACRFVVRGEGRFGFAVEGRDPALPLVVDPVFVYGTYLGGSQADEASGVAVDAHGAVYVCGWSRSSDFPVTPGAPDADMDDDEVVVFKLARGGRDLVWATYLGGTRMDRAHAIAVDDAGEAVVVGVTRSSDFPTTPGVLGPARTGGADAFVVRLSAAGDELLASTYLGGRGDELAKGVALAPDGDVLLVGTTRSSDFPATSGAVQRFRRGGRDAFVARLEPTGGHLRYATFLGGRQDEEGNAIAVDERGCAYVAGETQSRDFPITALAFDDRKADNDAFVTKLDPAGSQLAFSTFLGGDARDGAWGIAVDRKEDLYVVGTTYSSDFPTTADAFQPDFGGRTDAFVAKLTASGGMLVYGSYLGGSGYDAGAGLGVDVWGAAWVAGKTDSDDFPLTDDARLTHRMGGSDAFVAALDPAGASLVHATLLGGPKDDAATALAVDDAGRSTTVAGWAGGDLPLSADALAPTNAGLADAMVARFDHGICGRPARVGLLGSGCGAKLTATAPRLGRTVTVRVEGRAARAPGFVFAGPAGARPRALSPGCEVFLEPGRAFRIGRFLTDEDGAFSFDLLVGEDPALCGLEFVLQGAVISPRTGPLRFGALTDAVLVVLGD